MNRPVETLDTSGLKCPMPVLKTRRKLAEMQPGDHLHVTATDPMALKDMPDYCSLAGHQLLMAREQNDRYIFEIVCGKQPAD